MPNEASQSGETPAAPAPKVQYSPGTTTPEVRSRRPYPIVFVADLQSEGRLAGLTPVDKDDFARLASKARASLKLAIKPPLGSGDDWEFELPFDSPKSFEPASFLGHVAAGRWRLGLREKVLARRAGSGSSADLKQACAAAAAGDPSLSWVLAPVGGSAAAPGAAAAHTTGGSSILDLVDEPSAADRVRADVERLATSAAGSANLAGGEAGELAALLARLDLELGAIADAVLHHADFQRLELAWRGLKFLVDQIDFRAGTTLSVLDATRDNLDERLLQHVIQPAIDGEIPTRGMVVVDFSFANTPPDLALLDTLAQQAVSLPVPLVVPFDAAFFNVKSWRLVKNLPALPGLVDTWQFAKWKALRDQPYAKALVPIVGRFILRQPYEPRAEAREFTHAEKIGTSGHVVWGGAHLAVGVCAARSVAAHGWPTRMFGAAAGKIDNLCVIPNPNEPGGMWGPGDLVLPDRRMDELPEVGLNFLLAAAGKDYCFLMGGVSAARPKVTAETSKNQATLEISLPYQQFSNVTSAWLCEMLPSLRGSDAETVQKTLIVGLRELMCLQGEEEPEAVQVGVGPSPDAPGQTIVQVRLSPPGKIVPGGLHIDFGFAV